MNGFLKTIASRLLAAGITAGLGYIATKWGIQINLDAQDAAVKVVEIGSGLLAVYGVSHKVLDKHLNPGDAASTHIAAVESKEHAELIARDAR